MADHPVYTDEMLKDYAKGQAEYAAAQKQQEEAFALIEQPGDWKAPIDAVIPVEDYDRCREACDFFTATKLEIVEQLHYGKFLRVKAIGYRNGPAGP